ncbi:Sulfatase (fragment) [metagenome]
MDIFPTILDLIGIKNIPDVDGQSLVPLINGEKLEELPACIESPPELNKTSEKVIGIRTSKYKYLRDLFHQNIVLELYNLENDPLEEINIAKDNPILISQFEEQLIKLRQNMLVDNDETTDEEMKIIEEKLKKLGYT